MLSLAGLLGCHAGVGPVVGVGKHGRVSLGVEGEGGVSVVRGIAGFTFYDRTTDPAQAIRYPAWVGVGLWGIEGMVGNDCEPAPEGFVYGGGVAIGRACGSGSGGCGTFGGGELSIGTYRTDPQTWNHTPAFTVSIGLRYLGDHAEVVLAPKVHMSRQLCLH